MNKHFKLILAGAAIVAGLAGAVSCQDLKGELDNLSSRVSSLESKIASLESAINAGELVTDVRQVADGIEVVTGKQTYKITNGKDGVAGAAGDAWTIGDDGFWYKNGTKTEYKAIGKDGKDGKDGQNGGAGAAGDVIYYVPNTNGFFDKYVNGERVDYSPLISYRSNGAVTGVLDTANGQLTLSWDDEEGNTVSYVIKILGELKSLVTIPQAYYEGVEAVIYEHMRYQPLTWVPNHEKDHFVAATKVSDERQYIAPTAPWVDIYPLMKVQYYVNPENADLSDITLGLDLNKNLPYIQTRANASNNFDVKVDHFTTGTHNGHKTLDVYYKVTGDAATVDNTVNHAVAGGSSMMSSLALQVTTKGNVITSDYAAIWKQVLTDLRIVDPAAEVIKKFKVGQPGQLAYRPANNDEHYRRTFYGMDFDDATIGNAGKDPDAWIVLNTDPAVAALDANGVRKPNFIANTTDEVAKSCDVTMVYNDRQFDLMKIVAVHNWNVACLFPGNAVNEYDNVNANDIERIKALGLKWRFEVVRNYSALVPELTYQENFIWLNGVGNLSADAEPGEHVYARTHVYDEGNEDNAPSRTSIGRHPVVRVSLIHPVTDNAGTVVREDVVEAAYIKILIVDDEPEVSAVTFTFPAIGYRCDPAAEFMTTAEQMNEEIYHRFGMTKLEFHALYNIFDPNAVAGQVGTVIEEVAPNPATGGTHVIKWTLTPDEIWNIAHNAPADVELTRTVFYRNAAGGAVAVILKTTINPFSDVFVLDYENGRADYIAEYWIKHEHGDLSTAPAGASERKQWATTAYHVATPELNSTDATKCTFVNDINASFVTNTGTETPVGGYPAGTLKVVRDGVAVGNIQYFFDRPKNRVNNATFVKPGDEANKVENVSIRVSADGLILYAYQGALTTAQKNTNTYEELVAAGIAAANISQVAVIANNPAGPVGQYNTCTYQENDLAKALLNTDAFFAYIGAKGQICATALGAVGAATPRDAVIKFHDSDNDGTPDNSFKVDFLRPVTIETVAADHFIDAADFGADGSFIRYEDIVRPYDWRFDWSKFQTPRYDSHFDPNHVNYWQYYGLAPVPYHFIIHADLSTATCTLGTGNIPATIVLQANDIDNQAAYGPDAWAALNGANDTDWYTDISGEAAGTIHSFNKSTNTPLTYVIPATGKRSAYGYLTYNNNGTSVGAFQITVPMVVWYKWGKLTTRVTIDVQTTI